MTKDWRRYAHSDAEIIVITLLLLCYAISVFIFHRDYFTVVIPIATKIYYSSVLYTWQELIFYPLVLFCGVIGALSLASKNNYRELKNILLIALITFFLSYFVQRTLWYYHLLPVFCMAMLLLMLMLISFTKNFLTHKKDLLFIGLLAALGFAYPCYFLADVYVGSTLFKEKINPFINFMRTYVKNKPVYFFGTTTVIEFPAVDYAGSIPASRFTLFSWVRVLLKNQKSDVKDFFINTIATEINENKPKLIFVDVQKNKPYLGNVNFDYLQYFSTNQKFQQAWLHYRYLTTLEGSNVYKFRVYQREEVHEKSG